MKQNDVIVGDNVRVHLSYPSIYINAAIVSVRSSYRFTMLTCNKTDGDDDWRWWCKLVSHKI